MWVDNISVNWDQLGVSIPIILTLDFIGISFADSDAGGFLGQLVLELLNCLYHHDTKRPKPWLFDERNTELMRDEIHAHYMYSTEANEIYNEGVKSASIYLPAEANLVSFKEKELFSNLSQAGNYVLDTVLEIIGEFKWAVRFDVLEAINAGAGDLDFAMKLKTYFCILRHTVQSTVASFEANGSLYSCVIAAHSMLASYLSDLGKLSHLISLDYIWFLMICSTAPKHFGCWVVTFKVQMSNLDALNVDLQDYVVQRYNHVLEFMPEIDHDESSVEILKVILCDGKHYDMQKRATFVQRLTVFPLYFESAKTMAVKDKSHGVYPSLSGALVLVLWELELLAKHCSLAISTLGSDITSKNYSQRSSRSGRTNHHRHYQYHVLRPRAVALPPVTRQETVTFDLLTLWEGRDHVRRLLAPEFTSVKIDADNACLVSRFGDRDVDFGKREHPQVSYEKKGFGRICGGVRKKQPQDGSGQEPSIKEMLTRGGGGVFTPTFQWDSITDDSNLLIIGKLVSSRAIDDLDVGTLDYQGLVVGSCIKFPSAYSRNDILSRGPWTIKDSWLALASFDPSLNIDEYSFNSMNIWVHIYNIPLVFMDDDNIAHQTGDSLDAMIGKVIKIDTSRIDLNMVDYLQFGIILDYGDWLHYIPPKRQELMSRSKGSIQYLDANSSTLNLTKIAKASKADTAVESSIAVPLAVVTHPHVVLAAGKADASTNEDADDTATVEEGVTLPTISNGSPVTLHANGNASKPLAATSMQNVTITTSPILDNDIGKFLLSIWEVLIQFDE
ncbi:hypothetical protein V6N12_008683 [Hibiscus sabdariffa]|uniref:DUF4283 domain-containing protein n=1 Tax=Hibiscus sabdariffa TaxID=183260 RepID=A0ABR2ATJ8_9ROSI